MLFNSLEFLIFFVIFFLLYWKIFHKHLKAQNLLILVASAFFYGWWDWRFLFLLFFSILLDYFTGLQMGKAQNQAIRKKWFLLSVIVNLGFLGIFKYYNFFVSSFADMLAHFGFQAHIKTLSIILPVGISFYTFHGLSYVIDIYKKRIEPEKDFIDYAVFVSFFPLLVAGPIERATHLLPQIKRPRVFDYEQAADGLKQILWGLFKKVVVADTCAMVVNYIFGNYEQIDSGLTLFLGAVCFAFQIYGDFSGYSDIALGTAKMLGIDLLRNFAYPYFSRSIAEFWRRWHISLSTWFRDYLYIPLGGSKEGAGKAIRNTFIIFLVSGFWHGANFTFIAWGFLHALYIMPSIIFKTNRKHLDIAAQNRRLPTLKEFLQMLITFLLVCLAWIFFRSETITDAFQYIYALFTKPWMIKSGDVEYLFILVYVTLLVLIFVLTEWSQRHQPVVLKLKIKNKFLRYTIYYAICYAIWISFTAIKKSDFIYFAF
jgi:D-alanyl-lipoteichoic acid acyltransferase DltB (MBOAT superfamily)